VSAPGGGGGGGLYLFYTPTTITNSTISGNSTVADGDGGGIWNFGGDAYLTIINSTIAFNHSAGYGGGLEFGVIMDSTIVANNTANGVGPDMNGPAIATNCLFSNSDGVIIIGSGTGDLLDVDPMLDVLANNGGPTQTHALLAGSPAIDAGSNQLNLTTDQRGAGFNRTIGLGPDMGAFEVQPTATPTVTGVQVNDGSAQRSRVTSLTVTFSMQVSFATTPGAAFTLTRASDGAAVGFAATASVLGGVTVVTLNNFVGSAAELGSLADGRYILTALASQISANGQQMTSNYTFGAAQGLFRLFGDVNGDQNVNGFDLGFFRNAFGTQTSDPNFLSYLDFNGDGVINGFDLGQFRTRFGTMLP
jgi:hypothetical protein